MAKKKVDVPKMINGKILARVLDESKTTAGGIALITAKPTHVRAEVLSVSDHYYQNGTKVDVVVKEKDVILFHIGGGKVIEMNNEQLVVIHQEEVMGIE